MTTMTKAAGILALVLIVVVVGIWFMPKDKGSSSASSSSSGSKVKLKVNEQLAQQGQQLAQSNGCTSCHSIDGSTSMGPSWKGSYGTKVELGNGKTVNFDEKYISTSIQDPAADVRKGFSPGMPSFKGKVDPAQIKALSEYIKSLSG